jgi:nucleotide-binding universal stress UspA family protein
MDRAGARHVLVVGVDETPASVAAVRWAVREASLRHAAVRLICSWHYDPRLRAPYAHAPAPTEKEHEAAARARLATAASIASDSLPAGRLQAELTDKPLVRALLDNAADADLLILGTTRATTQSPAEHPPPIGPVTRSCLSQAPCAVVVVTS